MKKNITAVGAIIENESGEILCALRSPTMSIPNTWEFPGGKIEEGEDMARTIEREIPEELGCQVKFLSKFHEHTHEYDTFILTLITVKCQLVSGTPQVTEHSKIIWLKRENLCSLLWAPADIPTVELLMAEDQA